MSDDIKTVKVIKAGKFLEMVRRGRWEFVRRRGSTGVVGIVATTAAGELILIEQDRPSVQARVIELPAGLVGDDGDAAESSVKAGKREMLEETGYRAGRVKKLVVGGLPSAGLTDEAVDLVRAEGVVKVADGGGVSGESIEVHAVPLAEIEPFLKRKQRAGRRVDLKVWAALWFCRD